MSLLTIYVFRYFNAISMSYYLLPIFYIFSSLVPHSKVPILPISEVTEIFVEIPNVRCVAGCDLVQSKMEVKKFKCRKVDVKDASTQVDESHLVSLSNYHYQCSTDLTLPEDLNFIIR